jgi:hypothetical protein
MKIPTEIKEFKDEIKGIVGALMAAYLFYKYDYFGPPQPDPFARVKAFLGYLWEGKYYHAAPPSPSHENRFLYHGLFWLAIIVLLYCLPTFIRLYKKYGKKNTATTNPATSDAAITPSETPKRYKRPTPEVVPPASTALQRPCQDDDIIYEYERQEERGRITKRRAGIFYGHKRNDDDKER